jgi:tRNA(Ile2) C34 agmatinyltransferase TiaS
MEQSNTVAFNESLTEQERLRILKEAKGGSWYDGWKPYCMVCNYTGRMDSRNYGFRCPKCENMIGFNLERLKESPLNK